MDFQYISYQEDVYRKIGIYNKHTKLMNEGRYHNLSTNITFNINEKYAINEILLAYQEALIEKYISEGLKDKVKECINSAEKMGKLVKKLLSNIPSKVMKAWELLQSLIEKGISTVKEFLNGLTKLFQTLGENLKDVLSAFGFYKDDFVDSIPDTEDPSPEISEALKINDKKELKVLNYISNIVCLGMNDKSSKELLLNEGIYCSQSLLNESEEYDRLYKEIYEDKFTDFASKHARTIGTLSLCVPPVGVAALLVGGGYGIYKLLKISGDALSKKLEPVLLSDKMKDFAQKLYANKFFRYTLGLTKTKEPEEDESKLHYVGRILHTIILNGICAWIISLGLSFLLSSIFPINPVTVKMIVAILVSTKNIFKIIINRINNFKKLTVDEDGNVHTHQFFDLVTMVGLLSSISVILLNIPGVKDAIVKAFKKVFKEMFSVTAQAAKAELRPGEVYNAKSGKYSYATGWKFSEKAEIELEDQVIGTYDNGNKAGVLDPRDLTINTTATVCNNGTTSFTNYTDTIPWDQLDETTQNGLVSTAGKVAENHIEYCPQIIKSKDTYNAVKNAIFKKIFGKDAGVMKFLQYRQEDKFNEILDDVVKTGGEVTAEHQAAIDEAVNEYIGSQNGVKLTRDLVQNPIKYPGGFVSKIAKYLGLDKVVEKIDDSNALSRIVGLTIDEQLDGNLVNIAFGKDKNEARNLLIQHLRENGIKISNYKISVEFCEKVGGYIAKYKQL